MAAHSACEFGGGRAEKLALAKYRKVIWQGRVAKSSFTDWELRRGGKCPLTPEEIGLLLAALGFDQNTRLYLASHKVSLFRSLHHTDTQTHMHTGALKEFKHDAKLNFST